MPEELRRKILVMDDEAGVRSLLRGVLEAARYQVVTAADGRAGVEQAIKHRPDLIVSDNSMPVMDGMAALRALRANPATADIPVLFATANCTDDFIAEANALGATACFSKPFDIAELLAAIAAALS